MQTTWTSVTVSSVPQYHPPERKPFCTGVRVIRLAQRPAVPRFHSPINNTPAPIISQKPTHISFSDNHDPAPDAIVRHPQQLDTAITE